MSNTIANTTRHILNVTRSIASDAVLVVVATAALTSSAFAAQTCDGLKQKIDTEGSYLYRFQDKRQPELPLYVRYVKDEYKCGGGDVLDLRSVPDLENCYVPTCVIGSGEDDH